jgi:8-oxo-dGTP pyrophosphatase MutT (NUDIX family)
MPDEKSCGFLIVRGDPVREFLLMRHHDRWDLPKGHVDNGESELDCAYRELLEETGIQREDIQLIDGFRFTTHYQVRGKRDGKLRDKTLVIFLGRLLRDVTIVVTEHKDHQWFSWNPPHMIQTFTIDPLLAELERFLASSSRLQRPLG